MNVLDNQIKKLLNLANKEDLYFLGRRPSLKQISKEVQNFEEWENNSKPKEKRIPMADIHCIDNQIIGYNSFIIMNNANPTQYEKNFIEMGKGLNYFYFKKIFVHPDYRRQGVCTEFVKENLEFAEKLKKHSIMDVEKNNYKMINILTEQNFIEDFNWAGRNGMKMIRYFHE